MIEDAWEFQETLEEKELREMKSRYGIQSEDVEKIIKELSKKSNEEKNDG